ncbi:hypothetical protein AX14_013211 [Amanita brunnescens Koide BX004]|nr:hypothetical protein AX14_013211 [Amanita brunnescens Koide BX004]
MIKQRLQTVIQRLRRVFKKKSGPCAGACTEDASTDTAPSEQAEMSVDVTVARSSSTKSSDEAKSSAQHDVLPGGKEQISSRSSESSRGSEDLVSRLSESPTVPRTMPQLPTIVVGEDLEPIDLGTRRDSDHLPRDERSTEHNNYA